MNVFITFSDSKYAKSRNFSVEMALNRGHFDKAIAYTPLDINQYFKDANKNIFKFERGAGLWIWKPYIIKEALEKECLDNDFLFYSDAGAYFINDSREMLYYTPILDNV